MTANRRTELQDLATESAKEGRARWEGRVTGQLPAEPRAPARKPRGRSATEQAEALAGLLTERATKIQETATAEVRYYLAAALRELAEDTEARVAECQAAGEEHPVTDDYRAGLLLAAALVGDETFEY